MRFFNFLAATLALTGASAHPGEDIQKDIQAREAALSQMKHRSLAHCTDKIKRSGVEAQAIARRSTLAKDLMVKKGLIRRDANPLDVIHKADKKFTIDTPLSEIFGSNHSCLLTPETTAGPFYINGELVRSSLVDDEWTPWGYALHLDILVIDTSTCDPVTDAYVEIWSANATGVYGGISNKDNAPNNPDNVQKSWLRGIQPLNTTTGTVQFDTIFPGPYPGRTPHVHVMVHRRGAEVLANGTMQDAVATHTGQVFFDQDLVDFMGERYPYLYAHRVDLTGNADDLYVHQAMAGGNDPFVNYVFLSNDFGDGILGWITLGVDMEHESKIKVAGTYHGKEA
ncbi:Intradiol ring-cleavage dioxygenase [Podospora conica]|nr:Intradiol ring-cleavage dioxygenase [Schizothecium conicum]